MALDPNYMLAPNLSTYFVDKDTGEPLAGGYIFFYSDTNRATLKPIFTISGIEPDYNYVELPNPLDLSSVGTMQYNNNNILPYYYPFDANGDVELYYIEVYSSGGVLQFTREGFPNFIEDQPADDSTEFINYIPNGQFLAHYDIPGDALTGTVTGTITQATTTIAPGGWSFDRPAGSTATDIVTFNRIGAYIGPPVPNPISGSPRYEVEVNSSGSAGGDLYKDIRIEFRDVNKFSSDTQQYTFYFSARSLTGAFDISLDLIKNFGTGGDPETRTQIASFNIPTVNTPLQATFIVGANDGFTIGANDDDYIQIAINLPTNIAVGGAFTDFAFAAGNEIIIDYPVETNADMLTRSIPGWMPTPAADGSDLYLPLLMTRQGMQPDTTRIGKIYATVVEQPEVGELLCDGSQYFTAGYSADGIPYSRLQKKLFINGVNSFGNGKEFVVCARELPATLSISTAQSGGQSVTVDGAVPTNITFTTATLGTALLGFDSYIEQGSKNIDIFMSNAGAVTGFTNAGTTAFTVTITRRGTSKVKQSVRISNMTLLPAAGTYFRIATPTQQYYVWYAINGAGIDPAPGGIGIRVDLIGGTDNYVATATSNALNSFQTTLLTSVPSGAILTPNSYFLFSANSQTYYVWFSLDSAGTDPNPGGTVFGIEVPYSLASSADAIIQNVNQAINTVYFATPDLRGMFIRGWNAGQGMDPDELMRFRKFGSNTADTIGSLQQDTFSQHLHDIIVKDPANPQGAASRSGQTTAVLTNLYPTELTGDDETRPWNIYFNYVIKY